MPCQTFYVDMHILYLVNYALCDCHGVCPVFTANFSPLVQIMAAVFDILFLHEQLILEGKIFSPFMINLTRVVPTI